MLHGALLPALAQEGIEIVPLAECSAEEREELDTVFAEQLYPALRFGLIDHLATIREPMPLVMDEILVDFDATRLPRVRDAIAALAARHQVLFLTFHEDGLGLPGKRIVLPRG